MINAGLGRLLARRLAVKSIASSSPLLGSKADASALALLHPYTSSLASFVTSAINAAPAATAKTTAKKTTAKKSTATAKKTTAKKATPGRPAKKTTAAKKPAVKKAAATKKKAPARAVKKKPVAKKAVVKKKAKAVKKPAPNPLTIARRAALKPPPIGSSGWRIFFSEEMRGRNNSESLGIKAKAVSEKWKSLSEDEQAVYIQRAVHEKAKQQREYDAWVANLTPEQIRVANLARDKLRKAGKKGLQKIADARQVKRPLASFIWFSQEYRATHPHLSNTDQVKEAGAAWRQLSDAEKKKYVDLEKRDSQRYQQEKLTVYGHE